MRQRNVLDYLPRNNDSKEDFFIDITLYKVPSDLVREFALRFACKYPGGISEAIQDLMKQALKE